MLSLCFSLRSSSDLTYSNRGLTVHNLPPQHRLHNAREMSARNVENGTDEYRVNVADYVGGDSGADCSHHLGLMIRVCGEV